MTQGDFVKIDSVHDIDKRMKYLTKRIEGWDFSTPLIVTLKNYTNPRSLNQNALLHVWCRQMSDHFLTKIPTATPENMKLMMKHRFLGVEDIKVGNKLIEGQVKSSSRLDKGEMVHFMDNIFSWAADNGCFLSVPADSEYAKLKEIQDK